MAGEGLRVKRLSKEDRERIALELAKYIERRITKMLGVSAGDIIVSVFISDDWPYEVEVEVRTITRLPVQDSELNKIINKAIDEGMELIKRELRALGLKEV